MLLNINILNIYIYISQILVLIIFYYGNILEWLANLDIRILNIPLIILPI